jgi:hypothetical protein
MEAELAAARAAAGPNTVADAGRALLTTFGAAVRRCVHANSGTIIIALLVALAASIGTQAASRPTRGEADPLLTPRRPRPYTTQHARMLSGGGPAPASKLAGKLDSFRAGMDSCCTATVTNRLTRLKDLVSVRERYMDAKGNYTICTQKGTMPVVARTSEGLLIRFDLHNVRLVPSFPQTLISTDQIYLEQQMDSVFGSTRVLRLPPELGSHELPFDARPPADSSQSKIPTLSLVSALELGKAADEVPFASAIARGGSRPPPAPVPLLASPSPAPQLALLAVDKAFAGFHGVGRTSHLARLSGSAIGEVLHRRSCCSNVLKLRALPHMTADAPKNLASANITPCASCTASRIKKPSHSGHLVDPGTEPGLLQSDIKGPFPPSIGGYRYLAITVDEVTRYVFAEFLKTKDEYADGVARSIANFNATVGVPVGPDGSAAPRPAVRRIRIDPSGEGTGHGFEVFRQRAGLHKEVAPPGDHNINGLAESIIRVIDETATATCPTATRSPARSAASRCQCTASRKPAAASSELSSRG